MRRWLRHRFWISLIRRCRLAVSPVQRLIRSLGLTSSTVRGSWIHLDADVLNPTDMPAVDSPEPGGPTLDEIAGLVGPLVRHPKALGLELTIYDPGLDPDRSCAAPLVSLMETLIASSGG
jgi:arginase family enzyme